MTLTCRSAATLHLQPNLPPELWCKIFEDFEKGTLLSISSTCRYLHSIAQPFIFRDFHQYYDNDIGSLSDSIARLDYYASDAIAPHVRELSVSIDRHDIPGPDYTQLLTSFFNALPRFLNTRSLRLCAIDITALFSQRVSTLASLEDLHVVECSPPLHIELLPMLRVHTFTCVHYSGQSTNSLGPHRWLALLDADYLQVLEIPLTVGTCSFFASDNNCLYPFPSLHTVNFKCYYDCEALLQLLELLSKISVLRHLQLSLATRGFMDTVQSQHVIRQLGSPHICSVPFLEQYTGPQEFLPVLLGRAVDSPSAHLRRLILQSIPNWGHPLGSFVHSLEKCHPLQLSVITHLHISLPSSMDFNSLTPLQDIFPVLQELDISACKSYHPAGFRYDIVLNDLSSIPLPRSMVSLSIQWASVRVTTDLASLVAAKDYLVSQLPSLHRLWLCDWSELALLWSRNASGTEERCNHFEVGSLDRNYSAWKMRAAVFPDDPLLDPTRMSL